MNIEEEFRTELFIADDGDPGLRWLTDEEVIERMAEEIGKLRVILEEWQRFREWLLSNDPNDFDTKSKDGES